MKSILLTQEFVDLHLKKHKSFNQEFFDTLDNDLVAYHNEKEYQRKLKELTEIREQKISTLYEILDWDVEVSSEEILRMKKLDTL